MNTTSHLLEDSLLLVWNNRNASERLDLMQKIYAPDIAFFEGNDRAPFVGLDAINTLISKLQSDWPQDFEFQLQTSRINHQLQHVSWTLGPKGKEAVAKGIDIALIEAGKIQSLFLFLDTATV